MTAIPSQLPPPVAEIEATVVPATRLQRLDSWLEWLSEKLNPIVVKEARQALKSKQFTITFGLLLICGACWTALGVSLQIRTIFYAPSGMPLMVGYYFILSVPLLVIVPFVAFRSLAAEREDGTFELLSIATLTARQVVLGKLASAILQMLVYYSALAPCIAFTYLLRGLDIITIFLMLGYLFLASTLLSSFALALATVTKEKHWQVLLSVVLVAGLVLGYFGWISMMGEMFFYGFRYSTPYDQIEFWMANLALVMFHATFVALFIFLAAGQISFASDNRSTPLRWILFIQTALAFGWTLYGIAEVQAISFMMGSTVSLIYLWFAGSLLVGEKADLSNRVRRQLPQSFVGRMFLTWLNPGSGTGYFFILMNLGLLLLGFVLAEWAFAGNPNRMGPGLTVEYGAFATAAFMYAAAYLGFGRLLVGFMRNRLPNPVVVSFLLQVVLITFGTLIPIVVQFMLLEVNGYTPLQLTNPFWTMAEILDRRFSSATFKIATILTCLSVAGITMMVVNFFSTIREIEQTRQLAPQRVLEEDAAVIAARTPVKKKNPWDEPPGSSSPFQT